MVALSLTSSHIVDNGITPDVLHSVLLGDLVAGFTNDDSNLALIIDGLRKVRMWIDVLPSADDRRETLGEDDGVGWLINLIGAIKPRAVKLLGMVGVVLAYA
jgi:hypothetical protein